MRLIVSCSKSAHKTFVRKAGKCMSHVISTVCEALKWDRPAADPTTTLWTNRMDWEGPLEFQTGQPGSNTLSLLNVWNMGDLPAILDTLQNRSSFTIHRMAELDFQDMFWKVPRGEMGIAWAVVLCTYKQLSRHHFLTVSGATDMRVREGKFIEKGNLIFPVDILWALGIWSTTHEGIIQHEGKGWLQDRGIPIGGLLSSHNAEVYLLACAIRYTLQGKWQHNSLPSLHKSLSHHIHDSSFLYDECWNSTHCVNHWLSKYSHPPPTHSIVVIIRYRDNLLMFQQIGSGADDGGCTDDWVQWLTDMHGGAMPITVESTLNFASL